MGYTLIDPAIDAWTAKNSLRLFTSFADREARFVYVSSNVGECFQIAIDQPKNGRVTIIAHDIETSENEELQTSLTVKVSELHAALEDLLNTVCAWIKRRDISAKRFIP